MSHRAQKVVYGMQARLARSVSCTRHQDCTSGQLAAALVVPYGQHTHHIHIGLGSLLVLCTMSNFFMVSRLDLKHSTSIFEDTYFRGH